MPEVGVVVGWFGGGLGLSIDSALYRATGLVRVDVGWLLPDVGCGVVLLGKKRGGRACPLTQPYTG